MYKILQCGHSNESYRAVLSCGAVCYAVRNKILKPDHSESGMKLHCTFLRGTVYCAVQSDPVCVCK